MASYCSRLKSIVGLINSVKVLDILIDLSFIAMLGLILTVSLVQPGSRLSQVRISLAGATLAAVAYLCQVGKWGIMPAISDNLTSKYVNLFTVGIVAYFVFLLFLRFGKVPHSRLAPTISWDRINGFSVSGLGFRLPFTWISSQAETQELNNTTSDS
ncbi:hypothetical protein VKT23_006916 [Stygiomarasmius scandens]|uniref:Uncharacterized protein n=1 Tax=Marasmiellus scandens TaxID=2682957 RepID=A0ABR1JRU8_9AGAR